MKKTKLNRLIHIAVATTLMIFSSSQIALAHPEDQNTQPGAHKKHHNHHHRHSSFKNNMIKQLGLPLNAITPIVPSLKLNTEQSQKWKNVIEISQKIGKQTHNNNVALHKQLDELYKQPEINLAAIMQARQKNHLDNCDLKKQVFSDWIDFYNSLNSEQKSLVSQAIKKNHKNK